MSQSRTEFTIGCPRCMNAGGRRGRDGDSDAEDRLLPALEIEEVSAYRRAKVRGLVGNSG